MNGAVDARPVVSGSGRLRPFGLAEDPHFAGAGVGNRGPSTMRVWIPVV
jgi:hypothetical protein